MEIRSASQKMTFKTTAEPMPSISSPKAAVLPGAAAAPGSSADVAAAGRGTVPAGRRVWLMVRTAHGLMRKNTKA